MALPERPPLTTRFTPRCERAFAMSDESFHNDPFAPTPGAPTPKNDPNAPMPASGNRPAEGARQVTPGEALNQDFAGSEAAADFLGLDTEFTAPMPEGDLNLSAPPALPGTVTQEEAYQEEPYAQASEGPEGYEYADDEYADDEYDGYQEDEYYAEEPTFAEEGVAASSGRGGLLVGLLLLAGVVAGGVLYGPDLADRFLNKGGVEPIPVATGPKNTSVPEVSDPTDAPTEGELPSDMGSETVLIGPADAGAETPEVVADGGEVEVPPVEDFQPETDPTQVAVSDPFENPDEPFEDPWTEDPWDTPGAGEGSSDSGEGSGALADVFGLFGGAEAAPTQEFPDFESGLEFVNEDMLDMIWRGSNVPMEALDLPARVLTPRVGWVRVVMDSGESIEGKLYAMGQSMVWVQTEPGRVGLDGEHVTVIDALETLADPSTVDVASLASSERVRARVPGGLILGRVLKQDGPMVTLLSDDGARVTLREPVLEPLGGGRAVVVQR